MSQRVQVFPLPRLHCALHEFGSDLKFVVYPGELETPKRLITTYDYTGRKMALTSFSACVTRYTLYEIHCIDVHCNLLGPTSHVRPLASPTRGNDYGAIVCIL